MNEIRENTRICKYSIRVDTRINTGRINTRMRMTHTNDYPLRPVSTNC